MMTIEPQKIELASESESVNSAIDSEISVSNSQASVEKRVLGLGKARNQKRIRWDLFIMLLATFNLFQVPYSVAFETQIGSGIANDIINWFIDIFFILDILINFRTTVIDEKTGEDIMDANKIAMKYLKGKFFIDFLASIPFDFLLIFIDPGSNSFTFQLFGLLKLIRILRLSRLIAYMNLGDDVKMSLKLAKLIFFLVIYLHGVAGIWFFIVKQNEEWIPPLDYVFITTDLYDRTPFYQYGNSVYHSMLMLGGNDIGPRGTFQLAFITVLLFAGAIINANIFGNLAVLLQQLNRKATSFQEKVENANSAMKNLEIPENIQESVQRYLNYTQSTSDHQQELDRFLKMISPSLKEMVVKHISKEAILK